MKRKPCGMTIEQLETRVAGAEHDMMTARGAEQLALAMARLDNLRQQLQAAILEYEAEQEAVA
jgi:hypothetical protein